MEKSLLSVEIMNYLKKKKKATTTELCDLLHTSVSTLRRVLIELEKQNLVERVHGGVILKNTAVSEYSHSYRSYVHVKEKEEIARLAQDFIGPGMAIFLDSSSTVLHICEYLKSIPNLIVITNGLKAALELSDGNTNDTKVYIIGGEIKKNSASVISDTYENFFDAFQFNLAIFSARGIDEQGIYEASVSQARVKKSFMTKAKQTILLMDDSKFDSSHFFKIGDFKDYDAIITNKKPRDAYLKIAEENDIDLLW